ncbi:pertactin-like passenger domain-containing protein, partial [Escherichia coli]
GDQLVVNNNATGNFKIFVQDTGVSPQSDDAMTLVKTGGGDASFTLGNTGGLNRPGFPGECFICELRLPDHRFR